MGFYQTGETDGGKAQGTQQVNGLVELVYAGAQLIDAAGRSPALLMLAR
jgi:hypothetical protein